LASSSRDAALTFMVRTSGFGKGGNRYSYRKDNYEKGKNTKLSILF
jgi:hypothetical protein